MVMQVFRLYRDGLEPLPIEVSIKELPQRTRGLENWKATWKPRWRATEKTLFINPKITMDMLYSLARKEHAWLLRSEGLTFREIGRRIGCSPGRAGQIVSLFGRRVRKAMKNTTYAIDSHPSE